MQISENLPHFDVATLIIVSGGQSADMYIANNNEIEKLAEIKVEDPEYSDREGHFKRQGKGETYGSGAVYEEKDTKVKSDFFNQLKEATKSAQNEHKIEAVIFTGPAQDKKATKEHLPTQIVDKIVGELNGNFVGDHPDEILKRIQEDL